MSQAMDPMLLIGILVLVALVAAPFMRMEDRPAFRRPDRKPRPMVGPPW